MLANSLPTNIFNSIFIAIPEGCTATGSINCDGSIDIVNGVSPVQQKKKIYSFLNVEGWLAVSANDGLVPDKVFVTLKDSSGTTKYIMTRRTLRNDVKDYFNEPAIPDVGFKATADVTVLNGEYVLGLAMGYSYKGKLYQCEQFNIPVLINMD